MNSHQIASTTGYSRAPIVERVMPQQRAPRRVAEEQGISARTIHKGLVRHGADGRPDVAMRPRIVERTGLPTGGRG